MINTLKFKIAGKVALALVIVLGLVVGFGGFTSQAAPNPHRVIVTFDEDAVNEQARAALKDVGGIEVRELTLINGLVVVLPSKAMVPWAESLAGVARGEKYARVFALKPPGGCDPWPECKNGGGDETPPPQETPWGVARIGAPDAWSEGGGADVKVAIIDTGIQKNHPDLDVKGGINFITKPWWKAPDDKWGDDNGHGTHVAGTVAALDNDQGVVGVAPLAHLYAVKVLDRNGSGYVSDVISGIEWSVNHGMQAVNMSLGTNSHVQALQDAVDAAYAAGVVLVAAAGNSGDGDPDTNTVNYPAKYASVIAVAATASDDSTPTWSSEGEEVELSAPGVDVKSTWNDGGYKTISGTSMAAPHVSGVVALVLAGDSSLTPSDVRVLLQSAAEDLGEPGHDVFYGYGLVDAYASVVTTE